MQERLRGWSTMASGLVALAALLGIAAAVGLANPVKTAHIGTDALGPESGESAAQYVERAEQSLQGDGDEPRWALVSFAAASTTTVAADLVGWVRISQALFFSSAAGDQSPLVTVSTGASQDPAGLLAAAQIVAAAQLEYDPAAATTEQDRAAVVADLRGGCDCVVAVLVRGTLAELRSIAEQPGVRGVEALPADAVYGRFAVRALLPKRQA